VQSPHIRHSAPCGLKIYSIYNSLIVSWLRRF